VSLAAEQKSLAEDVLKSVGVRVDAAASPLIQKSRAEVERSAAAVALDAAKRDRAVARSALAALMARDEASFKLDKRAFFTLAKRDPQAGPDTLKGNPDVLKLTTALERSKAVLDLERANGVPDPRLVAGLVEIPSAKDRALVVGVSLPIPVFNANRGNIDRARGELSRTEQLGRDAALSLGADLTRAQQQMDSAYVQAQALKTQILPSAQEGFKLAREGYSQGRFPYLEVLDAQRSLFGAKQQQIAALRAYHTARAVLERLTARHAESLKEGAYQNEN
jgi:cobalt-zinc-cadmium efflux system outer membrane protein